MTYNLTFESQASPEDIQILYDGIMAQAHEKKDMPSLEFFAFFIRDPLNKILGGCNGNTMYGSLYIDSLWVDDSLRNQGYGTKLIEEAEKFGKKNGCSFATVNTMDWEALEFYKKLSYQVEFERRGFLRDSIFYFLRKELHA